jgi:hypothetical protein
MVRSIAQQCVSNHEATVLKRPGRILRDARLRSSSYAGLLRMRIEERRARISDARDKRGHDKE